jgi:DNA polymerase
MKGFFQLLKPAGERHDDPILAQCGACGLKYKCLSPLMPVTGKGRKKILICGEVPGEQEDRQNKQFVGPAGEVLQEALYANGVDLKMDCWVTNAVICRPPKNQLPPKAVQYCRPNLLQTIKQLQPDKIILLGSNAVESLIGHLWKESTGGVMRWAGFIIPDRKINAWVCPTYHPSFIMRSEREKAGAQIKLQWQRHLEQALAIKGKPWPDGIPEYESRLVICLTPDKAIPHIEEFAKANRVVIDYETNMRKPDHPESRILSCALCDGNKSVAFPWIGNVIPAMRKFIQSPVRKVAHNMKFELRWTLKEFGEIGRGWEKGWDSMVASHVRDSRVNTKSLKFQAYVRLGFPDYDSHIKPYMKGENSYAKNKLHMLNPEALLRYNAIDSLVEWDLGKIQFRELKNDQERP